MALIDFHAHLSPSEEARESLLRKMQQERISQCVVVAGGVLPPHVLSHQMAAGTGGEVPVPNRQVLELCGPTEGKLLPFYFANPYGTTEEYVRLGGRFYGLKLGPVVHGIPLADPRNRKFIDVAQTHRHCVYLHCLPREGFDVDALADLVRLYPLVPFVLGHAGIGQCDFFAVDRILPLGNVYFETSGGFSSVVKYAAERLGAQRILFGSEYPLQDSALEVHKIFLTDLPVRILNENARHLLARGRA